jgi:hypothetical protein
MMRRIFQILIVMHLQLPILCSALLELAKYSNKTQQKEYMDVAITILKNLSSSYRAVAGTNGGFILKHGLAICRKIRS